MSELDMQIREAEKAGVDMWDLDEVIDYADDHGHLDLAVCASNFPDDYFRLIDAWFYNEEDK